ncbi:MAG: hypothetical protein Fur0019_17870 [Tibeticola sp.]
MLVVSLVYVAFVVDVFARYIVVWRVRSFLRTDFVPDALGQGLCARRAPRQGDRVRHGDRGSQCVSIRSGQRPAEASLEPSAGRTGALAAASNGLHKAEITHRADRGGRARQPSGRGWSDPVGNPCSRHRLDAPRQGS